MKSCPSSQRSANRVFGTLSIALCVLNACMPARNSSSEDTVDGALAQSSRQHEKTDDLHVAILGDSQSTGAYGQRLSELIRSSSKQKLVYFGAASSARVGSWISGGFTPISSNAFYGCESSSAAQSCVPRVIPGKRTESISSILAKKPYIDLYILTFGDNHFYDPASIRNDIPRLIEPILKSGAKCAFVTPTEGVGRFANKENLMTQISSGLELVRKKLGRTCTLINSYHVGKDVLRTSADLDLMRRSVSQDPMGLHPQGSGARLWGERVFEALLRNELLTRL